MSDRTGASFGFVLAGVAAATTFGSWPTERPRTVAFGAAAVATVAFFVARRDLLDRRLTSPPAALGSVGIITGGLGGIAAGGDVFVPSLTAALGVLACAAAWADLRAIPSDRLLSQVRLAMTGAAVGIAGIASIFIFGALLLSLVAGSDAESVSPLIEATLSTLALGIGTITVAGAYIALSDLDRSYVDARLPTRREWGYVVGGTVLLLVSNLAISALFGWLGVESTTHSLIRAAQEDPEILLALVPLSYLVVGPGEELLYRNVIQKSLRAEFSAVGGIAVASVVFAAVHLPAYADPNGTALALLNTLAIVFVLSLILGAVYERTSNLTVSALVHGSFNAVGYAVAYADIAGLFG
ncbi:MAG: lysostaphin resistance A-like protein [Halobacteriales archaeon]